MMADADMDCLTTPVKASSDTVSAAAAAAAWSVPTPLRERGAAEASPAAEAVKERVEATMRQLSQITPLLSDLMEADKYQKDMQELRKRLEHTEEELHDRARELWSLRAELHKKAKEHQQDKELIHQQQRQLGEARDRAVDQERQVQDLDSRLAEAAERAAAAEAREKEEQKRRLQLEEQAKRDLQAERDRHAAAESRFEDPTTYLWTGCHASEYIAELHLCGASLDTQERLQSMHVQLMNDKLQQSLQDEGALHDLQAREAAALEELKFLKQQLAEHEASTAGLRDELEVSRKELAEQEEHGRERLSEVEAREAAARDEVETIQQQLNSHKAAEAAALDELKVSQQQLEEHKTSLADLQEKLDGSQKQLAVQEESDKARLGELEMQAAAARDEVETIQQQLITHEAGEAAALDQVKVLQEQLARQKTSIAALHEKLNGSQKQLVEQEEQEKQRASELEVLQEQLAEQKTSIADLQEKLEVSEKQLAEREEQEKQHANELEVLQEELVEQKTSVADLQKKLEVSEKQLAEREEQEKQHANELEASAREALTSLEGDVASHEATIAAAREELEAVQKQLAEQEEREAQHLFDWEAARLEEAARANAWERRAMVAEAELQSSRSTAETEAFEELAASAAAKEQALNNALLAEQKRAEELSADYDASAAAASAAKDDLQACYNELQQQTKDLKHEVASLQSELLQAGTQQPQSEDYLKECLCQCVPAKEGVTCGDNMDVDTRLQQLTISLQQLKSNCELLKAENCSLKEVMAAFEGDLDQHAQSIGHVNHKQKIRCTLQLREEIKRLLDELRRSRQRIIQLEANQTKECLCQCVPAKEGVTCGDNMDVDTRMQQLAISLQQLKSNCELLEAENCGLKEVMAAFEGDLDQHAQSIGHVNHKQKIRYTLQLRDEIKRLLDELRKSRQRIIQLEANQTKALASLGRPFACSCRMQAMRRNPQQQGGAPQRRRCTLPGPGAKVVLLSGASRQIEKTVIATARRDGWHGVAPASED